MSGKDAKEAPAASTSAKEGAGAAPAPSAELMAAVQARLAALSAGGGGAQQPQRATKVQRKQRYAFWETQPVVQFDAEEGEVRQAGAGGGCGGVFRRGRGALTRPHAAVGAMRAARRGPIPRPSRSPAAGPMRHS
jgi:hypothetical protein